MSALTNHNQFILQIVDICSSDRIFIVNMRPICCEMPETTENMCRDLSDFSSEFCRFFAELGLFCRTRTFGRTLLRYLPANTKIYVSSSSHGSFSPKRLIAPQNAVTGAGTGARCDTVYYLVGWLEKYVVIRVDYFRPNATFLGKS